MLLVQDQLAAAGPKPDKQEKHYRTVIKNNRLVPKQNIHKTKFVIPNFLSLKDLMGVGFNSEEGGPGGGGQEHGGPRSKDYENATKDSRRFNYITTVQENQDPNIISLDTCNHLGTKKASQLIIDEEKISIKPQIKKPKLKSAHKNIELPNKDNLLLPNMLSYGIEDDKTTRITSIKSIGLKSDGVVAETIHMPLKPKNISSEKANNSFKTQRHQILNEAQNVIVTNFEKPKVQEPLTQTKTELTLSNTTAKETQASTFNDTTSQPGSVKNSKPSDAKKKPSIKKPEPSDFKECPPAPPSSPVGEDKVTSFPVVNPNQIGKYHKIGPNDNPEEYQHNSVIAQLNNGSFTVYISESSETGEPKVYIIDMNGRLTLASKELENKLKELYLSQQKSDQKTQPIEESVWSNKSEVECSKNIEESSSKDFYTPPEVHYQKSSKAESEQNQENICFTNQQSEIKHSAQDAKAHLEISKPIPNEISKQAKLQNYANRITLVSLQLQALQAIEHHIDTWSSAILTSQAHGATLPAAGEYEEEKSFSPLAQIMKKGTLVPWISGHYGKSIQGKIKDHAAYRADLGGFSIGSDFVLNEHAVLGAFYTKITSKVKYRQNRLGDNATTDSHTFGLYGQYNISNALFAQSAVSYTRGSTKHHYINQESYKSSSRGFAGFLTLNNIFALSKNTFIVPKVGLRYIENKDRDVQVGDAKITGAKNHYLTAILGSKILFRQDFGDVSVSPGLYAGLEQPIVTKNKGARASIIEAGKTFEYQGPASQSKNMTYNLGAEVSAKRKNLVLSLSYRCSLAKKYTNQQGTLKIGFAF